MVLQGKIHKRVCPVCKREFIAGTEAEVIQRSTSHLSACKQIEIKRKALEQTRMNKQKAQRK